MRLRPARRPPPQLDLATIEYLTALLEDRLRAVETYGSGGCPTCHDAELRGSLARLRELAAGATRG